MYLRTVSYLVHFGKKTISDLKRTKGMKVVVVIFSLNKDEFDIG